ncbi:MAG: zinc-ribbon domain-containing protein [Blastocatellia bacterium]
MFCPKCGTQNKDEQKFCRGCGQSLSAMQLALEGRLEETVQTLTKNFDKLASGGLTLIIFTTIALAATLFSPFTAIINLALGLIIGAPMVFIGAKQLQAAIKQLETKERAKSLSKAEPAATAFTSLPQPSLLPAAPDTDPLAINPIPASVAEHTTHHLNRP